MDDQTGPRTLEPETYWRLRYLQVVAERDEAQAMLRVQASMGRYQDALREAGIGPTEAYRWHDESHSLIPAGGNRT